MGNVVLATLLGEVWDLMRRRDHKALRSLGGVAPVTKQSGKTRYVVRRRAVCANLSDVLHVPGAIASIRDLASRARYKPLRARGLSHARSLRTVGDRLLLVSAPC